MTNPNESAFPEVQNEPQFNSITYGLTKREYFAAMMIASGCFDTNYKLAAESAVQLADALIECLNKKAE